MDEQRTVEEATKAAEPFIIVAGHVVIDQVVDRIDQVRPRIALGGPASYSTIALSSLGYRNAAVTKVGSDFPAEYARFLLKFGGVDVESAKVDSARTTSYRIDRTLSPRRMWLLEKCKSLSLSDFDQHLRLKEESDGKTLVVNPVVSEVSLSLLDRISKEFETVLVDSQGFVRRISPRTSEVSMKSGLDISSLSGVDVLKVDREELSAWSGLRDVESSIRLVSRFVDVILFTSGPGEVDLYSHGKLIYRARPPTVDLRDTTGAGDIMLATFAARFSETRDLKEALRLSVSAASLAIRKVGVEKAMLDKVEVIEKSSLVNILQL